MNEQTAVRVKFRVQSIKREKNYDGKELQIIALYPVTSGSEENKKFYAYTPSGHIELAYTPSGHIELGTVNGEAAKAFDLGGEFYVDFTPAPPPSNDTPIGHGG